MVKVPAISRPNAPSGRNGSRSHDPVVRPDVLPGSSEVGPDAGVRASGQEVEGQQLISTAKPGCLGSICG